MAEVIATELIKVPIEKLLSFGLKKSVFVYGTKSYIDFINHMKSSLEDVLQNKDPFLNDSHGHTIATLLSLKDTMANFDDWLDARTEQKKLKGGSRIRLFFSSSNPLISLFEVAQKIKGVMEEFERMKSDVVLMAQISAVVSTKPLDRGQNVEFILEGYPALTEVVFGRDGDRENFISLLFDSNNGDDSISVASIVGIGGQGKTTLAQYVCSDERVKGSFDVQLWVSCRPGANIIEIFQDIIASATGVKPLHHATLDSKFLNPMSDFVGKKCLIVLDNIYYQDKSRVNYSALTTSLQNLGADRITVIATTRHEQVAKLMSTKTYMLNSLSERDSLLLLKHCAYPQGQIEGREAIEKDILQLCPKLPLVIRSIGCQLAERESIEQWEVLKRKLASNSAIQLDEQVMQTLKLSYDQLDLKLKLCLAFCSLSKIWFHPFDLILYWMALGYVESEDVGEGYVHKLVCQGFFKRTYSFAVVDEVPEMIEIHDVMYDLISLIGKSKHQIIYHETKEKEIAEEVAHVKLDSKPNGSYWNELLTKFKKGNQHLQSIISGNVFWPEDGKLRWFIIEKMVERFPCLRILELKHEGIKKVPKSIGELIHLRYLDLSCNPLCKLPKSITKLVNLLSLNLFYCTNLSKLPKDMEKLVKLRHLRVLGTSLSHMPKGIGKLTELQTLDLFVAAAEENSDSSKGDVAAKLEELGQLNNLKGTLRIQVAGESKNIATEAWKAHVEKKTRLTRLEVIFDGKNREEDKLFLEDLQPRGENLTHLKILEYGGGKGLPKWITDDDLFHERFPKLIKMDLSCYRIRDPLERHRHRHRHPHPYFDKDYVFLRRKSPSFFLEYVRNGTL